LLESRETQTSAGGKYLVNGLGEDYTYSVEVKDVPQLMNQLQKHTIPADDMPVAFRFIEENIAVGESLGMRRGVEVRAGEVTEGIDFVLFPPARVYGRVTDASSGRPVARLGIATSAGDTGEDLASGTVGFTWTDDNGAYDLRLPIEEYTQVHVVGLYVSNCDADIAGESEDAKLLNLEPGDEVELNFTVDAPILIPVRTVDEKGVSLAGVPTAVKRSYPGGGTSVRTGADHVSDAEGRVTWFGLPPDSSYVVEAIDTTLDTEEGWRSLGETEHLSGQPGETLPEQVIVCVRRGGIEGIVVDSEGIPVPDREVSCIGITDDGEVERITVSSDQNGAFTELWALPEGRYPQLLVGREIDGGVETTVVENVEIQYDGVAQLGIIQPVQQFQSLEEAAQLLGEE